MSGPTRFQAKTIAYVIKRFWGDARPARRFLVADEVGLGKTIVAREVIAEALRRKPGEDIDIVYLCSSQPVASQNLKRLKVHGHGSATKATRLTLFALEKRKGVRYFALTPTTSFNVAGRSGLVRERALIYFCLRGMFTGEGVLKILQQVSDRTWIDHVEAIENHDLDQTVIKAFRHAVAADDALKADVRALGREALVERAERPEIKAFNKKRDALVGRLRKELALQSAQALASNGLSRLDAVRAAFNSPFRPFVLASTAVGQEGLDFHPWCHAVVHWNLPRSPVELEQREGRVHRYKGHAVRLNVARFLGLAGLARVAEPSSAEVGAPVDTDPWKRLFAIAARHDVDNDLSPCWLFEQGENPTKIRRIVPYLNHSREAEGWPKLRARLATYRLVIGLPRQEDLLDALERNGITAEQAADWKIDLRPPPLPG